jgi:hypothetical protein
MDNTAGAQSSTSVPPVAESLSVEPGAQASEVRTKWVIAFVLVFLVLGGGLVFVKSHDEPTLEQTATPQVAPVPAVPQPASVPKGKDFGL